MRILRLLILLFLVCAIARAASAQETVAYASVSGRVQDQSGAAIAGASIVAVQVSTGVKATATTDRDGRYRFSYLRVGSYTITAQARSFAPLTRNLTLTVGAAFDLTFSLSIGAVTDAVTVTADDRPLETARSQIATTIEHAEVKSLPLNGRNFLDLALLVPGVSPTNIGGGTQLFAETSAVPGAGLSVGSQRNLSNNFMIDGLSANDDAAALSGMAIGVDAIDQFQVVTSGGQAELGRALGGHFSIATRSGTNRLLADGYGFFRDDAWTAKNALSGTTLPMHQNQFGGSIGGPLRRDQTFFFANAEQRLVDQSGLTTIPDAAVTAINARLAATGYQGPPVTTGVYPNPVDTTFLLAKVDHHFSQRDLFTVRYNLYDVSSQNVRGAGGLNAPSASAGLDNRDQSLAASFVRAVNDRTSVELRGQWSVGNLLAPPTDLQGPAVSIAGVATFGRLSSSPTSRLAKLYQAVGSISRQADAHSIRAGVDVLHNDVTIEFPRAIAGSYSFSTLANFLTGTYNNSGFTQTFGDTTVRLQNPNVGLFVQDEWRIGQHLTANLGLRYDLEWLPTITTDTNNLAPRAGLVWSPLASGRLLVRANAGRYFDRVPLRALANAVLSAGNTTDVTELRQFNVALSPAQANAPVFPAILSSQIASATLPSLTTMDPHLQHAYSDQASVEVERQLWRGTTVGAGYEHLSGRNLIMQINQNVPTCAASGSNNGCRPIPDYANNNQYSSAGKSVYDGLHVSFVQRLSTWGSGRVSYTYSKSFNNVGEAFFNSPIDPTDLSKDWGRSDDDQRHRLVVTAAVNTPSGKPSTTWQWVWYGFQATGAVQYYSALPFNIVTGQNTIQGTAARPIVNGEFIDRNAGEGDDFSSVNVRLSRSVATGAHGSLEVMVEVFNLFNHRNDIARITVFGTGTYPSNPAPNFNQVTVVGDPRSMQLGVRFRY